MRTNIEINEAVIEEILKLGLAKTRKNAIENSLHRYIRRLAQLDLLKLKGKVKWEGDLDDMRTSKYL